MAQLYADEDFPYPTVEILRLLGHDVLTAQEDGLRHTPDPIILARAHALGRSVLTYNRRDYEREHLRGAAHSGIVGCSQDNNFPALASRIHAALAGRTAGRWCIRVYLLP